MCPTAESCMLEEEMTGLPGKQFPKETAGAEVSPGKGCPGAQEIGNELYAAGSVTEGMGPGVGAGPHCPDANF